MMAINWPRVMLGGVVAGIIMNASEAALHGVVLGADVQELYSRYQLPEPSGSVIVFLNLMTFVLGICSIWLYAAVRPRYGAGPRAAVVAGLAVWVMSHLWSGVYLGMGFAGLFTTKVAYLPVIWGLIEAVVATLAGSWLYREAASNH